MLQPTKMVLRGRTKRTTRPRPTTTAPPTQEAQEGEKAQLDRAAIPERTKTTKGALDLHRPRRTRLMGLEMNTGQRRNRLGGLTKTRLSGPAMTRVSGLTKTSLSGLTKIRLSGIARTRLPGATRTVKVKCTLMAECPLVCSRFLVLQITDLQVMTLTAVETCHRMEFHQRVTCHSPGFCLLRAVCHLEVTCHHIQERCNSQEDMACLCPTVE